MLAFPIRNPRFTLVAFGLLIALGLMSWRSIPRGEDPVLDFPVGIVTAVYPGASAEELERLVVRPIEDRLNTLDRVVTIRSRIVDGVASVAVEFRADEDAIARYGDVVREMNGLRSELPEGLLSFSVQRSSTLDVAIAQIALVAPTLDDFALDRLSETLRDRLAAVPGVRRAGKTGVSEPRIEVTLNPAQLQRLGISPFEVYRLLTAESQDVPAGRIEAGARRFTVRGSGAFDTPEAVAETVLRGGPQGVLRIQDVAEVQRRTPEGAPRARFNGERAVFLTVAQQDGENIARVRDRIWAELDAFEAQLPAGVRVERGFDQAQNVSARLSRLGQDFGIALGLVLLTLLPLGLRAAGIVMVAIPLSLATGITLLFWAGYTINQLSIVGAVLALGLVVDDSIVVVENISRFLRSGMGRVEAALEGTRQIAVAAIGSTATLVLAFIPLIFLPGGPGQFIRSLPLTVVFTVVSSLGVALFIIPWLASRFLPRESPREGNRALQLIDRAIRSGYAPVLGLALAHPWRSLGVTGLFVLASFGLVPVLGFSLFPPAETPQFIVSVTAPEGSTTEATDAAVQHAESVLLARPEVRAVFASIGQDNPRIYYNTFPRRESPAIGQLFVLLHEWRDDTPSWLQQLRAELADYPGARLEVRAFENGPPIDAPIAIRVVGPDLGVLADLAGQVEALMLQTPGTLDVSNPVRFQRTDLRIEVDRDRAGQAGVLPSEIDRTLRMALEGLPVGSVRDADGRTEDLLLRLGSRGDRTPEAILSLPVASGSGALVPLGQMAQSRLEAAVPEIDRVDRARVVTVTSQVQPGFLTDRVTRDVIEGLESIPFPAGTRWVAAGEVESREESFDGIETAILVALFLILAILVLEFGSFRSTLIVAAEIPLGIMGGLVALFLSGHSLSFSAAVGFVALLGIEIKTSILLVDFTNRLRAEGKGLRDAILEAGEIRFLPILLTTLTAVGGLLPLALFGQALYAPLAWVLIGGLVSSTLIGRVITPVVYQLVPPDIPVVQTSGPLGAPERQGA